MYLNLINNMIINKNKINYIINKTYKYTLYGGGEITNKLQDIPQVSEELTVIVDKLKFYLIELNKLINLINDIESKSKVINEIDYGNFKKKYNKITKILSINDDDKYGYYDEPMNEEYFINDLKKLYYGFYKEREFKNIKDFDDDLIESIKNKISGIKKLNELIKSYQEKIKGENSNILDVQMFQLKDIEQQIKNASTNIDKVQIKPIEYNNNLISIEPIDLLKIKELSKQVIDFQKNQFPFKFDESKDIFYGGSTEIIGLISQFNNELNKCEKNLEKTEIEFKNVNLKKKNIDNYINFITRNLNKKEKKIYKYINKETLNDFFEKINSIKKIINSDETNKDYQYLTVVSIISDGLDKVINKMNNNIIIDIDKLEGETQFLFSLFNDFYNERLSE